MSLLHSFTLTNQHERHERAEFTSALIEDHNHNHDDHDNHCHHRRHSHYSTTTSSSSPSSSSSCCSMSSSSSSLLLSRRRNHHMLTNSLPHELLVKIFYNLETRPQHRHSSTSSISFSSSLSLDRTDILSCTLVCQDWYYAAVDTLWRDVDLQSVESFIHFSRALEPSFSYIGRTAGGSPCYDDNNDEDEDKDMGASRPIDSGEYQPRSTIHGILEQEAKEETRGAININGSTSAVTTEGSLLSTMGSSCPLTSRHSAQYSEILSSSASNSGLSSLSSSMSTGTSSLSSLSHGPCPGQIGFAGKSYIRTLSLAGSTDCQAPRPFPYLPSCITDRHLSSLSPSLTHLTSLNLAHCSAISDVSVIDIVTSSSPYLKKIDLTECRLISNLTVQVIARLCSQLEEISLQGCGLIRDDAIEELALHCTRLQKVDIGHCQRASDRAVLALLRNSGRMNACPYGGHSASSSRGLKARTRNARISRLGIAGCRGVTMIGLMAIGERLSPDSACDTDGDGEDHLSVEDVSSLLSFEFTSPSPAPRTQNGQGGLNQNLSASPARRIFRSLPTTLEEISIHDAHHLNHDDILCLVQRVGLTLKSLRLDNGNAVTSDTLTYILGACPNLTVLCIPRATRLDDTGVIQLATARCAASLVELDLSACRNLTDACLTRLALASRDTSTCSINALSHDIKGKGKGGKPPQDPPCLFPNLRRLDLSYNGKLTLTGIIPLVMSLKNLCALDVSFCGDGVTTTWTSSLETLRESLNPILSQSTFDTQGCANPHNMSTLSTLPSMSPSQHQSPPAHSSLSMPLQNVGTNAPLAPPPTSTPIPTTTGTVPWRRGLGRYVGPMLNRLAQDNCVLPQHPQQHPVQSISSSTATSDTSRRRFSNPGAYPIDDDCDNQSGNNLSRRFSAPSSTSSSSYSLASSSSFVSYSAPPIHLAGRTELLEQVPRRVGILPSFHLESWFTPLHQHQLQQLFQIQLEQQRELQMQVAAVANQGQQNQLMHASALASAAAAVAVLPPEMMVHPVMTATRVGVATIGGSTASAVLFDLGDDLDTMHGTSRRTTGGRRPSDDQTMNSGNSASRRSSVSAKTMASGHCEVSGWGLSKLREEWSKSITWA